MFVTLNLNMKLLPFMRDSFEDMINSKLEDEEFGYVDGGGTLIDKSGEVKSCDIEIFLNDENYYDKLVGILSDIRMAKGSKIISSKGSFDIGKDEGLAIYLNGTDLDKEVYNSCDVNYVLDKLMEEMSGVGTFVSHFEGDKETGLYFYGESFKKMKESIIDFVNNYPLCEKCRIVQIA